MSYQINLTGSGYFSAGSETNVVCLDMFYTVDITVRPAPLPYVQSTSGNWDNGYPVVTTKNKVRGSGRALQLKFTSESGKACHLLGYSANFTGTTEV